MVRPLEQGDTVAALELLRARPLANVFLEHVVRSGALGRVPGVFGCERADRLVAILMVAPGGGTALEVADPDAHAELAELAARLSPRPRHIVGPEDVTEPFWRAYEPHAPRLRWVRREPVYRIDHGVLRTARGESRSGRLRAADEADLDTVVMNSARQHLEDLGDNRYAADPVGFRERHRIDVREGRWWVLREGGRICFQVHVGPHNDHAVQIGGVLTPPDLRGRGYATRGVTAIVARLLARHPSVVLFCGEENHVARRLYERLGFQVVLHNRSFLLEASDESCSPAYV